VSTFDWQSFFDCPIVAILRGFETDTVRDLVRAVRRGGIRIVEVTMNSPDLERSMRAAVEAGGDGAIIGAGTVCTVDDLDRALAAGARFIVTPVLVPEVIIACKERGVPVMPGALTPTEIWRAWELGADIVKVFPANHFGPGYIRDVKAPLSGIRLMPTGGVDAETIALFRKSGADAFGVGSALFDAGRVAARNWGAVEYEARRLVDAYLGCA